MITFTRCEHTLQEGKGKGDVQESRASSEEIDSSLPLRQKASVTQVDPLDALAGMRIRTPPPTPATELHPLRYGYALVVRDGVVPPMPVAPPPLPENHSGTFYVVFIGLRVGIFHDWYASSLS